MLMPSNIPLVNRDVVKLINSITVIFQGFGEFDEWEDFTLLYLATPIGVLSFFRAAIKKPRRIHARAFSLYQ